MFYIQKDEYSGAARHFLHSSPPAVARPGWEQRLAPPFGGASRCSVEGKALVAGCSVEGKALVAGCPVEGKALVAGCSVEGKALVAAFSEGEALAVPVL
ncbi:MAG TPA: hypothetical protein VKV37_01460 [Ktedonobacteraceae bacterium]|nr:hypothetical protein [Ktedonobacteraceae bacterium]